MQRLPIDVFQEEIQIVTGNPFPVRVDPAVQMTILVRRGKETAITIPNALMIWYVVPVAVTAGAIGGMTVVRKVTKHYNLFYNKW